MFEDLLVLLVDHKVRFITVGGLAIIMNGFVRSTLDADVLLDVSRDNIERLLETLGGVGEGWARKLTVEDFGPAEGSIRVAEHFDIDLFVQMKGLRYEDFLPEARRVKLRDREIFHLSPQQLIRLKTGSYREKDQLDVIAMRNILNDERAAAGLPPLGGFWRRLLTRWSGR